jgi:hypothetical protein
MKSTTYYSAERIKKIDNLISTSYIPKISKNSLVLPKNAGYYTQHKISGRELSLVLIDLILK